MFAESMTEAEINRAGGMTDLRYFHTTSGEAFGYNERARKSERHSNSQHATRLTGTPHFVRRAASALPACDGFLAHLRAHCYPLPAPRCTGLDAHLRPCDCCHSLPVRRTSRRYHRSYGLVTPPTNPAFVDYRLGDLATAPLYRRDHLGFRVEYPDSPFSWTASSEKLKKNQKSYGSEGLQRSETPNLPRRTVQWQGSAAYPDTARQREFEAEQQDRAWAESQAQEAEFQRRFADRQAWERSQAAAARAGQESPLTRNGRAILTSSMSPGRLAAVASPPSNLSATQQQIELDHRNPNRYPVEAFKTSKFNPQFDPTDKRVLRAE